MGTCANSNTGCARSVTCATQMRGAHGVWLAQLKCGVRTECDLRNSNAGCARSVTRATQMRGCARSVTCATQMRGAHDATVQIVLSRTCAKQMSVYVLILLVDGCPRIDSSLTHRKRNWFGFTVVVGNLALLRMTLSFFGNRIAPVHTVIKT